jgi:hypothetical protein
VPRGPTVGPSSVSLPPELPPQSLPAVLLRHIELAVVAAGLATPPPGLVTVMQVARGCAPPAQRGHSSYPTRTGSDLGVRCTYVSVSDVSKVLGVHQPPASAWCERLYRGIRGARTISSYDSESESKNRLHSHGGSAGRNKCFTIRMRVFKYNWFRHMSLVCWFHCERSLSVRPASPPGPRPMTPCHWQRRGSVPGGDSGSRLSRNVRARSQPPKRLPPRHGDSNQDRVCHGRDMPS